MFNDVQRDDLEILPTSIDFSNKAAMASVLVTEPQSTWVRLLHGIESLRRLVSFLLAAVLEYLTAEILELGVCRTLTRLANLSRFSPSGQCRSRQ